ncbi:unnamed protein product [Rhizophagus irregularis]|nr:unnamed protein product [Rhizophagus irregularis]CAB4426536.1 unnamed protein product [Rhizophagus irregularis]
MFIQPKILTENLRAPQSSLVQVLSIWNCKSAIRLIAEDFGVTIPKLLFGINSQLKKKNKLIIKVVISQNLQQHKEI